MNAVTANPTAARCACAATFESTKPGRNGRSLFAPSRTPAVAAPIALAKASTRWRRTPAGTGARATARIARAET
jgi:hypothetical protein